MRDLFEVAGAVKVPETEDLTVGEMEILMQRAASGPGGMFEALSAAYVVGYAAGRDAEYTAGGTKLRICIVILRGRIRNLPLHLPAMVCRMIGRGNVDRGGEPMAAERTYTVTEISEAIGASRTTVRRIADRLAITPVVVHQGVQYFTAEDLARIADEFRPRAGANGPEKVITYDDNGERCTVEGPARIPARSAPWLAVVDALQDDLERRSAERAEDRQELAAVVDLLQQDLQARHAAEESLRADLAAERERHAAEVAELQQQIAELQGKLADSLQRFADLAAGAQELAKEARPAGADPARRGFWGRLFGG